MFMYFDNLLGCFIQFFNDSSSSLFLHLKLLVNSVFYVVQLTSTMLHVLSLVSSSDHEPLKDFLVKVSIHTYNVTHH